MQSKKGSMIAKINLEKGGILALGMCVLVTPFWTKEGVPFGTVANAGWKKKGLLYILLKTQGANEGRTNACEREVVFVLVGYCLVEITCCR